MQSESQKANTDSVTPIIPVVQKKPLSGRWNVSSDSQNLRFYEEYKKLLQTSFILHQQIADLKNQQQSLYLTVMEMDVSSWQQKAKMEEAGLSDRDKRKQNQDQNKPKRMRRTNNMIEKTYKCPAQKCQKIYASEGSLHQHLKIKHHQYLKPSSSSLSLSEASQHLTP